MRRRVQLRILAVPVTTVEHVASKFTRRGAGFASIAHWDAARRSNGQKRAGEHEWDHWERREERCTTATSAGTT